MKIFSNGYQIFNNEEEARTAVLSWTESSRAIAQKYAYRVGEIQEKTKVERKGIRHIFYFYDWTTAKCEKPCINSYSYLERNIGD
jgi:hypothetical protein